MPNMDQLKEATKRREARKAAREAAVETAHQQLESLSDTAAASKEQLASAERKPVRPRKEQLAEQRAAVEATVREQNRTMTTSKPDVSKFLGRRAPGRVPLHILNAAAQQTASASHDRARDIANAAGKAAFGVAIGKADPTKAQDKHARMAAAQAQMAAAKAAKTE